MGEPTKICLITGAASGIGLATAIGLAKLDYHIVFTAINHSEGGKAKAEILSNSSIQKVDYIKCDLSSFDAIKKCCHIFKIRYNRLDVLINNAGVLILKRENSSDGIEKTFAVNYLAVQLMTTLLLDLIKTTRGSRIINLSSNTYRVAKINFADIEMKDNYKGIKAYAQSKLALILFTKYLSRTLENDGVVVNAVYPGRVKTPLTNVLHPLIRFVLWLTMVKPEKGAETSIFVAYSDEIKHISGEYFSNKKVCQTNAIANDMKLAEKLWKLGRSYLKNWVD